MSLSTVRSAIDGTIDERPLDKRSISLRQSIAAEWRQSGHADLVHALRRHPLLLRDKSQLLNLAIEEYRTNSRTAPGTDLEQHCRRFREFGSSVERSIFRQLEAQRYVDSHPELLDLFSTPDWPKVGDQFGEFQILEELGVGSAAHVYLCLEADVGFRQVVVKATPFSSFEASILGRLKHPNIVQIHSTGTVDECNLNYLCMPFCGRSTLSDLLDIAFRDGCPRNDSCVAVSATQWMREGELPIEEPRHRWLHAFRRQAYVDGVLKIAIQMAEALEAAHEQGILHGDLKPSNVLLTPDGRPLLLDFNLSQDFVRSPSVCGGTLPYMPPEYLRVLARHSEFARDSEFNAASDVYSFGALLYELLTGRTPVNLEDSIKDSSAAAELILAQLERGVPEISEHNRFVSRKLKSIVLRCLSFDADNRPATMTEIKKNLQSELWSLSALGRTVKLRPFFFASVVGLPLAVLAGTGTYIAVQPDRYVAAYNQGLQLAAAGKFGEAVDSFASSVHSNPSFAPSRFQLGCAQVAIGNFDAALEEFNQLARKEGDVHSMAYVGYCFNKKLTPVAAIPWYERAIHEGAISASVYNNLGASYIDAPIFLSRKEQFRRAEDNLNKALELDPTSKAAQLNLVRCATFESKLHLDNNPWRVWRTAWSVLNANPANNEVKREILAWFRAVNASAPNFVDRTPTSTDEEIARKMFADLIATSDRARDGSAGAKVAANSSSTESHSMSSPKGYFLEPVLVTTAR